MFLGLDPADGPGEELAGLLSALFRGMVGLVLGLVVAWLARGHMWARRVLFVLAPGMLLMPLLGVIVIAVWEWWR